MDPLLSTGRDQWKGRKDRSKISINSLKISQKINSLYSINKYIYIYISKILQIKIIIELYFSPQKIFERKIQKFFKKIQKIF